MLPICAEAIGKQNLISVLGQQENIRVSTFIFNFLKIKKS